MINSEMKDYHYYLLGGIDSYGQPSKSTLSTDTIKIAIFTNSQSINESVTYSDTEYIGITYNNNINDDYIIKYTDSLNLKVEYAIPNGKKKQIFLTRYEK